MGINEDNIENQNHSYSASRWSEREKSIKRKHLVKIVMISSCFFNCWLNHKENEKLCQNDIAIRGKSGILIA